MPTLTIRNIPLRTHEALKARAARSGRSMEAEARRIIGASVEAAPDDESFQCAVRDAQAAFARYRVPSVSAADELIADRRLEARRETLESDEWIARAASLDKSRHAERRS